MTKSGKTKILCIVHDANLYGSQYSMLQLLQGLDKNGYAPYVVIGKNGPMVDELKKAEIPVFITNIDIWLHACYSRRWRDVLGTLRRIPFYVFTIAKIILKYKIDVVYSNTVASLSGGVAARLTGKPHIWHIREKINLNSKNNPIIPEYIIYKAVSLFSTILVTNTHHMKEVLSKGIRKHINVVHNGVDLRRFSAPVKPFFRSEIGIKKSTPLIAIIGSVSTNKGQDIFIEAAKMIKKKILDTAFVIVGSGSPQFIDQLKEDVTNAGMQKDIHFLGWRADVDKILAEIDLLILASEHEPFGKVIIEAMAAGKPVVATRSGGPEEIIVHECTGLLVPVSDAGAMAEATLRILKNEALAKTYGTEGRKRVHQLFSEEKYISEMERLIYTTVNQTDDAAPEEAKSCNKSIVAENNHG